MNRRFLLVALLVLGACSGDGKTRSTSETTAPGDGDGEVVLAAGDIAGCGSEGDEATARLLDDLPGTILALGDLAYNEGSAENFEKCYDPGWGRHKTRTRPAPGNHEYGTGNAQAYYDYFGLQPPGWYSFDIGSWHVVALNSNCGAVGGCDRNSEQVQWLRADLAAHPQQCTLAYWHHPRYSSGVEHGDEPAVERLWRTVVEGGVDVVLNGHEHHYERFAPIDGVRQFVVGTGGRSHYPFAETPRPESEVRGTGTFGVLELRLLNDAYRWRFVPVEGESFTDTGEGRCR